MFITFSLNILCLFGLSTEVTMLEGLVETLLTPQLVGLNQMSTVVHLLLSGEIIISIIFYSLNRTTLRHLLPTILVWHVCDILVRKPEEKISGGKPRFHLKDRMKVGTGFNQIRRGSSGPVNTVINLQVP
jgi:hypothetical protein